MEVKNTWMGNVSFLNSSLSSVKVKQINHLHIQGKDVSFFKTHKEVQDATMACLQKYTKTDNENTQSIISLKLHECHAGKSYKIAEDLIKP